MSAHQVASSFYQDSQITKASSKNKVKKEKSSEIMSNSEDLSDTFSSALGKRYLHQAGLG